MLGVNPLIMIGLLVIFACFYLGWGVLIHVHHRDQENPPSLVSDLLLGPIKVMRMFVPPFHK